MKKSKSNNYSQRNRDIYIFYSLLLESKGEHCRYIPRNVLYEEVAEVFYLKKEVVGQILSKITKSGYIPSSTDIEDFLELRSTVVGVINCEKAQKYISRIHAV